MKIIDNFLEKSIGDNINQEFMASKVAWYYNPDIIYGSAKKREEKLGNFQFTHNIYSDHMPQSTYFDLIKPVLIKLNIVSILRIKANLLTKTNKVIEYETHKDNLSTDKYKIAIYYINTCNGYTKIKNKKIYSKQNRILLFKGKEEHLGSSCSDQNRRVLININYI